MKSSDSISGLFWLAVGILLSLWAGTTYEIGILTQPGPGYLPLALGIILILLSLILLLGKKKPSGMKPIVPSAPRAAGWKKILYTVLILAVAAFFFEKVGYLITFFFLIFLLMKGAAEPQSWKRIILAAFLTTLGIYLIFVLLLEQPLPRGFLGV